MLNKNLFKLLGDNKKYLFVVVALMIVGLLSSIGTTICICCIVNLAINGTSTALSYLLYFAIAIICILIRYTVSRINSNIKDRLGRNIKKDLRAKAYAKIVKLGVKEAEGIGMAGLTQTAMEGVEQLDIYFTTYIPQFFFAMIAPIILFLISVWVDWREAVVLLAMVPLIPMSIIAVSKYAKKIFAKYWGKYISMGGEFLDSVQGLKELKIFMADQRQHKIINQSAEEFRKITMKVLVMQLASTTIMDTVAYGGAALGIMMVILNLVNGWGFGLNLSPVVGALFLILTAVDFFLPLRAFGSAFHVGMNGASAGEKLLAILDLEEPKWGDEDVSKTNIEFKNVTFSYDKHRDVLSNINATFEEGKFYALVGESGCGKSTMVNLISGALRPNSGDIFVGDKKLESLSRENYYKNLSIVSYDTYIFSATIRENFYLVDKTLSDEKIFEALKKVNLVNFVNEVGGLDKVINEDAQNISGGQKQRLALAINLVSNKNIYVFDEATSNIDIESEAIIMQNIKELSNKKTVIVVSHRLKNVENADVIYYVEKGKILETGNHQELMSKCGGYAKLYNTQIQLEEGYRNA